MFIITQIVFLILKITETVNWDWIVVLIPIFTLTAFISIFLFVVFVLGLIRYISTNKKKKAQQNIKFVKNEENKE